MIFTIPRYINGDNLNLKNFFFEYSNDVLVFSSRWIWLKKILLFFSPISISFGLVVAILLSYGKISDPQWEDSWLLTIVGGFLTPTIWILPFALIYTYYLSFVKPKKTIKIKNEFLKKYIPLAKDVVSLSVSNSIFQYKNLKYELALTEQDFDSPKKSKKFMLLGVWFEDDKEHSIYDENGRLLDSVVNDWTEYCRSKNSCRNLYIMNNLIYVVFSLKDMERENIEETFEQMKYLMERFHLMPV